MTNTKFDSSNMERLEKRIEVARHATGLSPFEFGKMLGVDYDLRTNAAQTALNITVGQLLHLKHYYHLSPSWFVEGVRGVGTPPKGCEEEPLKEELLPDLKGIADLKAAQAETMPRMSRKLKNVLFTAGCDTLNDVKRYVKTRGVASLMKIKGCSNNEIRELKKLEPLRDIMGYMGLEILDLTEAQKKYFSRKVGEDIEVCGPEYSRDEKTPDWMVKSLSTRTINLLRMVGCRTPKDVVQFWERYGGDYIVQIDGIGRKSINELREFVSQ